MENTISNKEFLFIYDAALCNPNGDPDQENKPRMDRATKTNLVSDTRLKRYIRDYLIEEGKDIFVSMMGGNKVSVGTRLKCLVNNITADRNEFLAFVNRSPDLLSEFNKLREQISKPKKKTDKTEEFKGDYFDLYKKFKPREEIESNNEESKEKKSKELDKVNNEILTAIIKEKLIDIRFFGGAFAVEGFSKTITGPIQVNVGYSLHPVELNDSNSIVTIMGDKEGQSGIGKKETLHYSLIGFTGTINSRKAELVRLTDNDVDEFRRCIIQSLYNQRSDSKKNQYPRLYLEIEYKNGETYGRLGDLRNLVEVKPLTNEKVKGKFENVRSLNDLQINFAKLHQGIEKIKDKIEKIRVWKSLDDTFSSFDVNYKNIEILKY